MMRCFKAIVALALQAVGLAGRRSLAGMDGTVGGFTVALLRAFGMPFAFGSHTAAAALYTAVSSTA